MAESLLKLFVGLNWKMVTLVLSAAFLLSNGFSAYLALQYLGRDSIGTGVKNSAEQVYLNLGSSNSAANKQQVDKIFDRNLFNSEGKFPEDDEAALEEEIGPSDTITKTDLPIELVGTIYPSNPYQGMAIITNTKKKLTNSFWVGDTISNGAKIAKIEDQRIIIDRGNGRFEYAESPKLQLKRNTRGKKAKSKPVDSQNPLGLSRLANEPAPTEVKREGFERAGDQAKMTKQYKNQLLGANFAKVLSDAKATPHMENGRLAGFVLTRIRDNSIYRDLGLQNGDIVVEINGVPFTDTGQAIGLLHSLKSQSSFEIVFLRDGARNTVNLDVQ